MTAKIELLIRTWINLLQKSGIDGGICSSSSGSIYYSKYSRRFLWYRNSLYLPIKNLNHISISEIPVPKTPLPPPTTMTPFTDTVLISLALHISAVRVRNAALNQLIQSGEPCPTPAKIGCVIQSSERFYTSKSLLEREKKELRTVVMVRKQYLRGKRKSIGD